MSEPENVDSDLDDQNSLVEVENGHITDPNSGAEDDNSENEALTNAATGEYDRDIPTTHCYLGKLNPLSGYTLFEDGEVLRNIYAIYTNTLVFPGFTLPLVMNDYYENRVLQNFIDERNKIFVLLCANSYYSDIYEYGVTLEIFETNVRNQMVHVKARGRQRCKRLTGSKVDNVAGRIKLVTVKILGEPPIVSPLEDTQLLALKSKRPWRIDDYDELSHCKRFRRHHIAQFAWPTYVYEANEVGYYTKILLEGLSTAFGKELVPTDPEKLSYWFVQNYHLNHRERIKILSLRSTLERLKMEVIFLRLGRTICCDNCETEITDPSKAFAMSKDGLQSNYVNPGGHVYETVTVLSANNFQLVGSSSKQFSWFPGYAWTIMQCKNCSNHLGWRFTSSHLTPKMFYGLANSGIKIISAKPYFSEVDCMKEGKISFANDFIGL